MSAPFLVINSRDNVAVALRELKRGEVLTHDGASFSPTRDIPPGHKIAIRPIGDGEDVIKYGYPIGAASAPIAPGDWVHTHNMGTKLSQAADYEYAPDFEPLAPRTPAVFMGYPRADGSVGVRNEIWILPTVGCVNDVCSRLAREFDPVAKAAGLDGAYAFTHPYGCSQMGGDHLATRTILAGLARHPNAGGVFAVGLGCENNTMAEFQKELGVWDAEHTKFMICQDEADELEAGRAVLSELISHAAKSERRPVSADKLIVGLKCGGSDGLSGISANAVAGAFCDALIAMGGSAILTETPEMFGAEATLLNRCASETVFGDAAQMLRDFKSYYIDNGQVVYENPSPGNKAGGITTLEDKSLGCVQKGGRAPVTDVLPYGGRARKTGLTLLSGPGNDLVSTTALTAAGAQLILFTTGRGTPFGAPAVTLKIASNSALAEKKKNWIDFDAGSVVTGESVAAAAERLMELTLKTASGEARSRAEQNGYREIAIFKNGVTL